MTIKLKKLLAELALAGTGNQLHTEAETIAHWLDETEQSHEAALMIRLQNLMNQGCYQAAMKLPGAEQFPSLAPLLAFCAGRLGHGSEFDSRIAQLSASDNPLFIRFAAGMRALEVL